MLLIRALKDVARRLYRISIAGLSTGPHVTRYFMYRHLSGYAEQRPRELRVLSISGSEFLAERLGFTGAQIIDASYPEANILALPFEDGYFDAVVSDQVLEHVEGNPQAAIDESFRVLKAGGLAVHTTCFINPMHMNPGDFWRFTPAALKLLTEPHGEVEVGGWGNFVVWLWVALGLRHERVPHARWHPAHWLATLNHEDWLISTWVVAKKNQPSA